MVFKETSASKIEEKYGKMDEVIEEEEDESKSDQPVAHSKTAAVNSIGGNLLSFNHNSEKRLDDELLFSQDKPREKDISKINRTETRTKSMRPGQSPFVNVETLRQDANASQGPRRKSTIR